MGTGDRNVTSKKAERLAWALAGRNAGEALTCEIVSLGSSAWKTCLAKEPLCEAVLELSPWPSQVILRRDSGGGNPEVCIVT